MSDTDAAPPARAGIWRGPALISGALVALGLATYAYLTLAARVLDPEQYGRLAAFWSLVFALLAGSFTPLEIEGTRAVSSEGGWGRPVVPVVRRLGWIAVGLTGVLLAVLALAGPLLADALFDGDAGYVALLAAVAVGFAVLYLGRGVFAGSRHFGRYSMTLVGEGVVRFLAAVVLVLAGLTSGLALAAAVPLGAILVAAVTAVLVVGLLRQRALGGDATARPPLQPDAPAPTSVTANFGSLLVASLAAQALTNAGPITAQALGDDPALTGALLAAFILVRVPVMFISALQTGFIPGLVAAVRSGGSAEVNVLLRSIVTKVGAIGLVAVVGAGLLGPWVVGLLFGTQYQLQGLDFAVLTLATVAFVLASMLQAALVALDRHRVVALAWVAGLTLYLAMLLLPIPLLRQVEVGYLVGTVGVLAFLWLGMEVTSDSRQRQRQGSGSGR